MYNHLRFFFDKKSEANNILRKKIKKKNLSSIFMIFYQPLLLLLIIDPIVLFEIQFLDFMLYILLTIDGAFYHRRNQISSFSVDLKGPSSKYSPNIIADINWPRNKKYFALESVEGVN